MSKPRNSMAEKKFAMIKKKGKNAPSERETEELKNREKHAKLRALRLAKEETDRVTADQIAAEKALAGRQTPGKKKAGLATS